MTKLPMTANGYRYWWKNLQGEPMCVLSDDQQREIGVLMKKSLGFWLLVTITVGAIVVAVVGNLSEKQTIATVVFVGALWLMRHHDAHQEWLSETFSPSSNVSAEERTRIFQRDALFYLFNIHWGLAILLPLMIYIAVNLE
jgi:heme/copper-type cytochrome/quinol oxidase subunit 4